MATHDQTGSDPELRPLRDALALPGASPADRFIALGLNALYPTDRAEEDEQAALASGWSRLADSARKVARRRRRAYLLRELLRSWNLRPRQLLAAAFALALIFVPVERRDMQTVPDKVLVASRVTFTAESQELRLLGGAEVEHGAVEIDPRDRGHTRIALWRGKVRLQVPPIPNRGRLVVETSDAAVIVHGTRFTVRKLDDASTAVAVEEGLVEVRGLCAAQRKDNETAIRWFEEAGPTSPDSVHADNALAREARLRADRSAEEGTAAWRRYLERFPEGLHREMAERTLSPVSPKQEHDGR